jgi:hypothetical protein
LELKYIPLIPISLQIIKGIDLACLLEIDRLLAFRKDDKYVNSAKEFQIVTKVSDSLLHAIAPYFKFPDWVKNKIAIKKKPKL